MEHDQRVCPRCGEPAGDYSFCESCRSHMDSLTGIAPSAAAHAGDAIYPANRALREVVRLEEALAAASKGISERIAARASAAAVEVDPDPLAASGTELVTDVVQPPLEVARLEDVLTIAPPSDAITLPEPPHVQAEESGVESPPRVEQPPVPPAYVAAAALREAFWFEQASAFKPGVAARQAPEATAARVGSVPPPAVQSAEPDRSEADAPPAAEPPAAEPSSPELWIGRARSTWPVAVWILALVAVLMLLTRRGRRGLS
jgi:hypothetical protein